MTDPTPDAPSPFERACAAYYASLHEADAASWDDVGDNVQYIIRRGFAAGLRELREPAMPDSNVRAWLDVLLMDAPE